MLALPQVGMARSVGSEHNVRLDAFCDWIEASLAFTNLSFVSGSNIVDVLMEEEIYERQEFAWEFVDNVFAELHRRKKCLSFSAPFEVEVKSNRAVRTNDWNTVPSYAFCLTLACAKWYPRWSKALGGDYTKQGQLFEQVAERALGKLLPGWSIHRAGWSPDNKAKIKEVVSTVAKLLREPEGEFEPWVSQHAKEAGLDIVCYRPFEDSRPGLPTIFVQCSIGKHQEHKLGTPNMEVWGKLIRFTTGRPQRSFATPYVYTEDEFKHVSVRVNGLLLDRIRLLSAGSDGGAWIPDEINKHLRDWVAPRIAKLERAA